MQASILIVDQNAAIRELLLEFFAEEGFLVAIARDDVEAWEIVRRNPPSAIVLERHGPVGEWLLERLRSVPDLAVVVTTTEADLEPIDGIPVVEKPFNLSDLAGLVWDGLRPADQELTG